MNELLDYAGVDGLISGIYFNLTLGTYAPEPCVQDLKNPYAWSDSFARLAMGLLNKNMYA